MSETLRELIDAQNNYEQRFSCAICLCACLRMVYGMCQHRICEDCLYRDGVRRSTLQCCPMCYMDDSFPSKKPLIPEDNIALQHSLGVRKCPHQDCKTELWEWELDTHIETCTKQRPSDIQKRRSSQESASSKSTKKKKHSLPPSRSRTRSQLRSPEMLTSQSQSNNS